MALPCHHQLSDGAAMVVRNGFLELAVEELPKLRRTASSPPGLARREAPCALTMVKDVELAETDIDSRSVSSFGGSQQSYFNRDRAATLPHGSTTAWKGFAGSVDFEMVIDSPSPRLRGETSGSEASWLLPETHWSVATPAMVASPAFTDGYGTEASTSWGGSPSLTHQVMPPLPGQCHSPLLSPTLAPTPSQWVLWAMPQASPQPSPYSSPAMSAQSSPTLLCQASPMLQHQQQLQLQQQQRQQQQQHSQMQPAQLTPEAQLSHQMQQLQQIQQLQQLHLERQAEGQHVPQYQQQHQQQQQQPQQQQQQRRQQQQHQQRQPLPQRRPEELCHELVEGDSDLDAIFSTDTTPAWVNTVTHAVSASTGVLRFMWTVDASKLRSHERQAVSPTFELPLGEGVTSRLVLFPRPTEHGKGSASFRRSKGWGSVQLKCETSEGSVAFMVSIGDGTVGCARQPCGPLMHDFASHSTCSLPKGQDQWDFSKVVNRSSQTFAVCLDILLSSDC